MPLKDCVNEPVSWFGMSTEDRQIHMSGFLERLVRDLIANLFKKATIKSRDEIRRQTLDEGTKGEEKTKRLPDNEKPEWDEQ
jgi:hypothetical protein